MASSYGFRPRRSAHSGPRSHSFGGDGNGRGVGLDVDVATIHFDPIPPGRLREISTNGRDGRDPLVMIANGLRLAVWEAGASTYREAGNPAGGVSLTPFRSRLGINTPCCHIRFAEPSREESNHTARFTVARNEDQ